MNTIPPLPNCEFVDEQLGPKHTELLPFAEMLAQVAHGFRVELQHVAQSDNADEVSILKERLHEALIAEADAGRLCYHSAAE